jgi:hypothetical protein
MQTGHEGSEGAARTLSQGEHHLAVEGQWWARERNIEAVWCTLPTFDEVCEGVYTVTALGNDGIAVNIVLDAEEATLAAGRGGEQVQLAYLGRFLGQVRRQELMPYEQ